MRCRRTRNKTKGSNPDAMPENPKQNEGIESMRDAGEPKTKEGIKFGHDAREPETKGRDRIWVRCWRNQNKTKGSNPGTMPKNRNKTKGSNSGVMPENPKQKEGIESEHDTGEPEPKGRDRIWARYRRT